MTRWHNAACTEPQVFLVHNWPTCATCRNSCPQLETIRAGQPSSTSAVPELPPDEPPEKLNLWWPLSVPYINLDGSRPQRPAASHRNASASGGNEPSPIYDKTLTDGQFRLVCLSAVEDSDYPLHVMLETYSHDSHPEYEAASYLWGGEDGDYSLQKQVFIGPFWDVALLTKNCWSMLRFARPWRGVRMLFVDAVCINQQDVQERGTQVAMMGRIYTNCTRVMVYLGEDIVTGTRQFPPSRPLHQLGSEPDGNNSPNDNSLAREPIGLAKLLRRQYFSRVWMIQELVLSERALFRVGEINYRADAKIIADAMSKLGEEIREDSTARWVQCLGKGKDALGGAVQLLSLMQLTRNSRASDPRDLIYGVLPLAGPCLRSLTPDYSISFQHFLLGVCAHLLLQDKQLDVFTLPRATPKNLRVSNTRLASWLPDFVTSGSWQDILCRVVNSPVAGGTLSNEPHMRTLWSMEFRQRIAEHIAQRAIVSVYYHHHRAGRYNSLWYNGASVCSVSGALSIKLTYLFAFSYLPNFECTYEAPKGDTESQSDEPQNIYSLDTQTKWPSHFTHLYLVSQTRLSELILPGRDHLFVLLPEQDAEYIYLILRRLAGTSSHTAEYTLVTSDVYLFEAQPCSSVMGPTSGTRDVLLMSVAQMIAEIQLSGEIRTFLHLEASGTRVWTMLGRMVPDPLTEDWWTVGAPYNNRSSWFRFKATKDPEGKCDVYIEFDQDGKPPESGIQSWKMEGDEQDALFQVLSLYKKHTHRCGIYGPEWIWRFEGDSKWRMAVWKVSLDDGVWSARTMLHCAGLCQRQGSPWVRQRVLPPSGPSKSWDEEFNRRLPQDILMMPLSTVVEHFLREIERNMTLIRKIWDAYDRRLKWRAFLDMLRVEPTEAQKYILERKTIGPFKLDGETMDVKIV